MELESYNGELDWLNVRSETCEDSGEGRGRFSFVICPSPLGHYKFFPLIFIHQLFTILLLPMDYGLESFCINLSSNSKSLQFTVATASNS
jgi:hypothetical protein